MTANIGLRLRFGETYVVVRPTDGPRFEIDVTDALGRDVDQEARRRALEDLMVAVSTLRAQVFDMLGRQPPRQ